MTAKASSRIWIIKCGFASGRTSGAHGNKWGLGGGGRRGKEKSVLLGEVVERRKARTQSGACLRGTEAATQSFLGC